MNTHTMETTAFKTRAAIRFSIPQFWNNLQAKHLKGSLTKWESGMDVYTLPNVKQLVGSSLIAQDQLGALWPPRGVG